MSKIVAFLQNPWFKPETVSARHLEMYRTDPVFHRMVLARSMTGRRLVKAFGALYDEIHWDNASPAHADVAPGRTPPDYTHIGQVVWVQRPQMILTFGRVAELAVQETSEIPHNEEVFKDVDLVWSCHHPNARHQTQADLNLFAWKVIAYANQHGITEVDVLAEASRLGIHG